MVPSDKIRASLALRQAALVSALVSGVEPPPGFDSRRIQAAVDSLAWKRTRSAARAWPGLAHALGKEFAKYFAAYAAASVAPSSGGPLADGRGFARWLARQGLLPEAGRRQAIAVDLRHGTTSAGLVRRRWPMLRVAWSRQSRRMTIAIWLPSLGERWFTV